MIAGALNGDPGSVSERARWLGAAIGEGGEDRSPRGISDQRRRQSNIGIHWPPPTERTDYIEAFGGMLHRALKCSSVDPVALPAPGPPVEDTNVAQVGSSETRKDH